jgi:predicted transcriptional regulator of viral defense system
MNLEGFFARHSVFTVREMAVFLDSEKPRPSKATNSLLAYHTRAGHILRVRRGLYVALPPGSSPGTYSPDPFLLAAKMTEDAVLAYYTALEFHGKAYSIHKSFTYATRKILRPSRIGSFRFRAVQFPKALRLKGKEDFEVTNAERAGITVRVTTLERTLVDVLDRPNLSGSWEQIWRSLESIEFFDLSKVVEYAVLLGNATTAAKVGFFLDQHRDALMAKETHLKPLRDMKPRRPHYLERSKRHPGRLIQAWNLVVPESVIGRSWAEIS